MQTFLTSILCSGIFCASVLLLNASERGFYIITMFGGTNTSNHFTCFDPDFFFFFFSRMKGKILKKTYKGKMKWLTLALHYVSIHCVIIATVKNSSADNNSVL